MAAFFPLSLETSKATCWAFAESRQAGLLDAADVDVDILRAGAS